MLVRLSRRGAQIVVRREQGASVVSVSFYGIVRGRLVLLRLPPPMPEELGLFGTVGTGDTEVHCRAGGPLVVTNRGPVDEQGRRFRITSTQYRLEGARFRVGVRRGVVVSQRGLDRASRRFRVDTRPFAGCVLATGAGLH